VKLWLIAKWPYLAIVFILVFIGWLGSLSDVTPCPAPVEQLSPLSR
jgi:hypothetical protein